MQNGIQSKNQSVRILTQVSILIALAVIIRALPIPTIPPFGRLSFTFASFFSQLIPIMFGPGVGGVAAAVIDLLAVIIRGEGFMWHFPVMYIFCLILLGFLWRYVKIKNRYAKLLTVVLITDIIYATLNLWGLMLFMPFVLQGDTFWIAFFPRIGMAIFLSFVKVHFMIVLLSIYERYIKK